MAFLFQAFFSIFFFHLVPGRRAMPPKADAKAKAKAKGKAAAARRPSQAKVQKPGVLGADVVSHCAQGGVGPWFIPRLTIWFMVDTSIVDGVYTPLKTEGAPPCSHDLGVSESGVSPITIYRGLTKYIGM